MSGLGVFVTHKLFIKQELESGILKEIGQPVTHPDQGYYFACRPEALRSEAVLTLRSWLRNEFQKIKTDKSSRLFLCNLDKHHYIK